MTRDYKQKLWCCLLAVMHVFCSLSTTHGTRISATAGPLGPLSGYDGEDRIIIVPRESLSTILRLGARLRDHDIPQVMASHAIPVSRSLAQPLDAVPSVYLESSNPLAIYVQDDPLLGGLGLDNRAVSSPPQAFPANFLMRNNQPVIQKNPKAATVRWGYDDISSACLGPNEWTIQFPTCGSIYQSPIDISASAISYSPLPPLDMYTLDGSGTANIVITNRDASVAVTTVGINALIEGGNLPGRFIVTNLHFHWSRSNRAGSEHHLQGRSYPLELHIVSYNSRYRDLGQAAGKEGGVHVTAILFEVSRRGNRAINDIANALRKVGKPGAQSPVSFFNISAVFPDSSLPYYRYIGSTTTPPCHPHVIWTVFSTPQVISLSQLNMFRSITQGRELDPRIGANGRPEQPLNNRVVYTNNPYFAKK